jgi:hypothetical protein
MVVICWPHMVRVNSVMRVGKARVYMQWLMS